MVSTPSALALTLASQFVAPSITEMSHPLPKKRCITHSLRTELTEKSRQKEGIAAAGTCYSLMSQVIHTRTISGKWHPCLEQSVFNTSRAIARRGYRLRQRTRQLLMAKRSMRLIPHFFLVSSEFNQSKFSGKKSCRKDPRNQTQIW